MNYTTWEQRVRKVEPYTPGEQPKTDNVIKLNTNENPFPPSPMVEKVIKEYNEDALRLYPDTRAGLLVDALAKRYGVDSDQVFVGVGSDDVISQTFLTFFTRRYFSPILHIRSMTYGRSCTEYRTVQCP